MKSLTPLSAVGPDSLDHVVAIPANSLGVYFFIVSTITLLVISFERFSAFVILYKVST